nr:hypothetical protein [Chlamydiota bacterium]
VDSASLTARNQTSLPLQRPYALAISELVVDSLKKYQTFKNVSEIDMSKFNTRIECRIIPTLCFIAEKEAEIARCNQIYQLVRKAIALNTAPSKRNELEKDLSESIGRRIENYAEAEANVLIPLSNSPSVKFIRNLCNKAQKQTDPNESYQTIALAYIEQQKIRNEYENQEALIEIIHTVSSMTRYYNSLNEQVKNQILERIRTVTKNPELSSGRNFSIDLAKAEAGFGDYQAALTLLQTASKEHPIKTQYVLAACEIAKFSIQEAYQFIEFAFQIHPTFVGFQPHNFPLIMEAICAIAEAHRRDFPALIDKILKLASSHINALAEGEIKQKALYTCQNLS